MNGFNVYRNIMKPKNELDHKAKDLYLKLFGRPDKNVDNILFLKTSICQHKKEIELKAKTLFELREKNFKKLVNKGIIKSDFDLSGIDVYKESIAERTKLRKQEFEMIKKKRTKHKQ